METNASPAPPSLASTLVGRVHHIVSQRNSRKEDDGRKRPRPSEGSDENDARGDDGRNVAPRDRNFRRGFVFVPEGPRDEGIPLVVPLRRLGDACAAASMGRPVRISRYSLVRYRGARGEVAFSTGDGDVPIGGAGRGDDGSGVGVDRFVVEVHRDGLSLVSSEGEGGEGGECEGRSIPMTLGTLARNETRNRPAEGPRVKKKKPAFGKDPVDVTGVVDAISPILVNGSHEEAFAMMELYQPPIDEYDAEVKSAVAVIRGEKALCVHPAIQPGQSITLAGVVSRKWKVPAGFQKRLSDNEASGNGGGLYRRLEHRVPDRVLLITEASAIHWNDDDDSASSGCDRDVPLPSTVESLTSVRGVVQSVQYHQSDGRKAGPVAHFVTLTLSTSTDAARDDDMPSEDPESARIYLLKYAVPPNLALGMQPGAVLRAVNVHPVPFPVSAEGPNFSGCASARHPCYMACLRSTLAIERCAGEYYSRALSCPPRFVARGKPFLMVPDHRITEICSDPFNTRSSGQYLAEEEVRRDVESRMSHFSSSVTDSTDAPRLKYEADSHNSKSLEERIHNPHSPTARLDALFSHHRRSLASGNSNREERPSAVCSYARRKSDGPDGGKNGRTTMREPYAEFFDHAHSGPFSSATECGSSCNDFSCFTHHHHCASSCSMPLVAGLMDLRDACAQNFVRRVTESFSANVAGTHEAVKEIPRVTSGWTSSHHYRGLDLCQVLNDHYRPISMNSGHSPWHDVSTESVNHIYTWGNVQVDNATSLSSSIHDKVCMIPLSEIWSEEIRDAGAQPIPIENTGSPTWVQIDSLVVSCLCLGSSLAHKGIYSNQADIESSCIPGSCSQVFSHTFLPSMLTCSGTSNTSGHGFVFLASNSVFIASVHIIAKSIVSTDRSNRFRGKSELYPEMHALQGQGECSSPGCVTNAQGASKTKHNSSLSIQECLEQTSSDALIANPASVVGRLIRARFMFRKLKSVQEASGQQKMRKCYVGWTITLGHIDDCVGNVFDSASVLQTVEVKVSVPFGKSMGVDSAALSLAVLRLFSSESKCTPEMMPENNSGKIISPDQVTMALAWWAASKDSLTSPLLSGGWDERRDLFPAEKTLVPSVRVEIPFTSRTFSRLGYQRFECNLNEINSFFFLEPGSSTIKHEECLGRTGRTFSSLAAASPLCPHNSEPLGVVKLLPGMLNRRLRRAPPPIFKCHQGCETSEPLYNFRNRHSPLTWLKCQGGVPGATLADLHWGICSALKERDNSHLKPSLLRRMQGAKILGISFCRARAECTQCFQALTGGRSSKNLHAASFREPAPSETDGRTPPKSCLFCPSSCSHSRAAVRWECSAVVDDGTGQAKLYAERECALLLLGGSLDVATVEKGAWELDGGVLFQPALPASSHLIECMKEAKTKASKRHFAGSKLGRKEEMHREGLASAFALLPANAKAEYILHQHCRHWYQNNHHRKMDLFCRCKPLSEDVTSVNQAEIQVAKAWTADKGIDFASVLTSTLPPLKLTLEDACNVSKESYDDNMTGWNLLRRHKEYLNK